MSHKSTIEINVWMDEQRVPESITWKATDSTADMEQKAKAMLLAFWDSADKSALRIDLWGKDMMVDEMGDFFYQMLMTMADTFQRATNKPELAAGMKDYARSFMKDFRNSLLKEENQ